MPEKLGLYAAPLRRRRGEVRSARGLASRFSNGMLLRGRRGSSPERSIGAPDIFLMNRSSRSKLDHASWADEQAETRTTATNKCHSNLFKSFLPAVLCEARWLSSV